MQEASVVSNTGNSHSQHNIPEAATPKIMGRSPKPRGPADT